MVTNIRLDSRIAKLTVKLNVFHIRIKTEIPMTQKILNFVFDVLLKGDEK